jgi:hypothetical protein
MSMSRKTCQKKMRGQQKICPPQMKPNKHRPIVLQCCDSAVQCCDNPPSALDPISPAEVAPQSRACAPGCCPDAAPTAPSPPCTSYPNCPTCSTLIRPSSTSCATICRWLSQLAFSTRPVVASEVEHQYRQPLQDLLLVPCVVGMVSEQPYVALEREDAS